MARVYEHNRRTEDIINCVLGEPAGNGYCQREAAYPSYVGGENKKKATPIGFIPKGATCQIISGEECALWGSNPRPAD